MSVRARPAFCGLDAAMEVISGKWKVLILWALRHQPHRFGALKRLVPGVSEKVLIQQLRELEADGIVLRTTFDQAPLRVEYSLTPTGVALNEALEPLGAWGREHLAPREEREPVTAKAAKV
ncbi:MULTISPECIES: winged helix-turn-helix transcriptional regulator [unclassified Streptomyces]|uniref:winged helix-turn-helix transcriptional regulator n=1 Tax=unclassified Streptomyces TaxID=2593676 RepID=UPI003401C30D